MFVLLQNMRRWQKWEYNINHVLLSHMPYCTAVPICLEIHVPFQAFNFEFVRFRFLFKMAMLSFILSRISINERLKSKRLFFKKKSRLTRFLLHCFVCVFDKSSKIEAELFHDNRTKCKTKYNTPENLYGVSNWKTLLHNALLHWKKTIYWLILFSWVPCDFMK